MNDTSSPQPTRQPLSVHGEHHSHGSLHLIVGMLGVLLVLETIVFGYVVTQYVDLQNEQEAILETRAEVADTKIDEEDLEKPIAAPFVYIKDNKQVVIVNRITGKETVVYTFGSSPVTFNNLFAVPQVGFDGRIFITSHGESDIPSLGLSELDITVENPELKVPAFLSELPFTSKTATLISPDETHLAAVYYNPAFDENSREIVIWDLLSGEKEVVGTLNAGEAFSRQLETLGGAGGYNLDWTNLDCVKTYVYSISETGDDNEYLTTREYCKK